MSKITGTGAGIKFLISAFNMVKRGEIKSLDELLQFAKQEFGEIDLGFIDQIKDTFKKGQASAVTEKRTKDIMKGDVVEEKGLSSLMKELEEKAKNLKKTLDESKKSSLTTLEDALDAATGFRRSTGSKDKTKPFRTPDMPYQKENPNYRLPGGSMYAEGNLRTAIRQFLRSEMEAGNLKVNETDAFRVKEYSPMMEDDPIDVFRRYYGEDALQAADDMADSLKEGTSFKNYEEIFRRDMPEIKVKLEGAGEYDSIIKETQEILKKAKDDADYAKTLDEFDVIDRKKNSMGGINRLGYADGNDNPKKLIKKIPKVGKIVSGLESLKGAIGKVMAKFGEDAITTADKAPIPSKTLEREMFKKADKRLNDKRMLDDDEYQNFLDEVGGADQLEAYNFDGTVGDAQRILKEQKNYEADMFLEYKKGNLDPVAGDKSPARKKFLQNKLDEMEMSGDKRLMTVDEVEELSSFDLGSERDVAKSLAPKMVERLELKQKYPGITDDLLDKILIDDNMQRKAEVLATIDEAFKMMEKGKGPDEILDTIKNVTRTKNSEGGFNTITLDKEFTKVFEDASSKKLAARDEKQATREKRYRELIASNKFPELNNFFREKIIPRVQANIGGAFTTGQRQQRANQSYQDYLARQQTSGTAFRPGPGNNPVVTFPTFNPPTTTPTPPTTTPTPPPSGGGGGGGNTGGGNTGGGGGSGSAPPLYYPPNSGGGGGGNYTGGGGSTKPFDPGMPIGAASGAEAIAAYKNYLAGVDRSTTPFTSFDEWRKGTSQYSTDQLLYDLTNEEGQNQYQLDKSYLSGLKGWEDPRGGTGKEAIAGYEKYLAGLTSGTPVGFDSWRKGTGFEGSLTFQDEDYKKLLGIRDLVSKGQESGNFKYDLGGGYTGEDPRGTGPGYTEEGEGSQKAPPGYEGDDSETFLEKKKREEAEAAEAEAAKKEQEEGGGADYFPETETISKISEAAKTVDTSDPSQYSQFINANANATVGKDSRGKIFTLANLIKAGLFVASGGLSGGIEQAITTAAKQYAKKKAVEYAKEKIGIGSSQEELPETALSNNLIGSNTNAMPFNKGGRVKLYNGGIPGFTEAEIAQRRNQQLRDAQERNRTSSKPITQMPMIPPGGAPKQPANLSPITNSPKPIDSPFPGTGAYTPPAMSEQGALPGFGTNNPGGEEYISTPQQSATPSGSIDLNNIMNMDTFQYEKFMGDLSPEKRSEVENQLNNMGPMAFTAPGENMPPGMGGDPMLAKFGVSMSDYESMTMDQQDDLHAAVRYTEQFGAEPYTQSMILKERGINPDQFIKADGSYDKLALTQAKLASDIQEAIDDGYLSGVTLTGNESFQDLVALDKKYLDAIMEERANTPAYDPSQDGPGYDARAGIEQWNQQQAQMNKYKSQAGSGAGNSLMASGGRAGFKFGSMLETSNPDFGKPKKDKSHEYLLRLLKNKQTKQLNNSLKKMVSKSRQVKDKSPEQIAKAMKKLQQLKSFYGKR